MTETLVVIITWAIFLLIIIFPAIFFWKISKHTFISRPAGYLTIGLLGTTTLLLLFAWWTNYSTELLLEEYGYNFNGFTHNETYKEVLPENIDRVQELQQTYTGIGWPIKAIILFILYIPYIIVIYLTSNYLRKKKTENDFLKKNKE